MFRSSSIVPASTVIVSLVSCVILSIFERSRIIESSGTAPATRLVPAPLGVIWRSFLFAYSIICEICCVVDGQRIACAVPFFCVASVAYMRRSVGFCVMFCWPTREVSFWMSESCIEDILGRVILYV